jgi:hypothetical protein
MFIVLSLNKKTAAHQRKTCRNAAINGGKISPNYFSTKLKLVVKLSLNDVL